jgi:hypothetical protein
LSISNFIPTYHFIETHSIDIKKTKDEVWYTFKSIDIFGSPLIKYLFFIRGIKLKFQYASNLRGWNKSWFKINSMFQPVCIKENQSLVLLLRIPNERIKIGWDFLFTQYRSFTRVTTQTRVYFKDISLKELFRIYWFLISFFSGIIRLEILRYIKNHAIKGT